MQKAEIVLFKNDEDTQLDVLVEDETVWLNRKQLSLLFKRDIKTIGKHINNALKEELANIPVVAIFATTALDGKVYQVEHYNLDMILSVGYRVKSGIGVKFRIWANQILRDYLLKGYAVHQRLDKVEHEMQSLKSKANEFDLHIKNTLPQHQGVFFDGQVFDAWHFVAQLIKQAQSELVLFDNYIDDSVLKLFSKRDHSVRAKIFTKKISKQLQLDIQKHNEQYPTIEVSEFARSHDRFLVIDQKDVYHIGASLKDLGKKWFAFSKLSIDANLILNKLV